VSSELGRTLTARGRRSAPFAAGLVAGLLVAGLLVPFVRGHGTTVVTGGTSASAANALDEGSRAAADGQGGGTGADGSPGSVGDRKSVV